MFFPYLRGDEIVNHKAAAFPEKDFIGKKGGKLRFWNLDNVLAERGDVYITEGEWDACSLIESGVPVTRVLSVPNGAQEDADPDDVKGYRYVEEALAEGLGAARRFIWCGDSDEAGRVLRSVMVKLLGAAKFWFVEWPEGVKDANEMLTAHGLGAEALLDLVTNGALPWPSEGLFRLNELPEPSPLTLWDPGFVEWEGKVKLAPGTTSLVIGHPGMGKTRLWAQIWYQIVREYGQVACIATFETRPKPHYRRILRELYIGRGAADHSLAEIHGADAWIDRHYIWAVHPQRRMTLEWLLDQAEIAVVRHGARIVQIDPWNRLESTRPKGESETDYIGRCIQALYDFAVDMSCHVQVLAHPAKMEGPRRGKAPYLEDTAGSKHWENMIDQGFTVHREKLFEGMERRTEATLYHRKSRFEELGFPCRLELRLDLLTGRYRSIDYEPRE